jgi:hypothetical protein
VIRLDGATVLLQWATGGLFFLWVTTRRREVGIGYGWLLRATYGVMAVASLAVAQILGSVPVRDICTALVGVTTGAALWLSIVRRKAGVREERARQRRRTARVSAMTGIERSGPAPDPGVPEFPPLADLVPPLIGAVGLVAGGLDAGGPDLLAVVRTLVGAAFLGAVSDAMLLGHWYLVQPGLGRAPLVDLNRWLALVWPVEVAALLWPTGMLSVISGRIDDGYGGLLGWFWATCAVSTLILTVVTKAALKERAYSAVMAATGLLYLAILTAFGTDLVARAVLAPS